MISTLSSTGREIITLITKSNRWSRVSSCLLKTTSFSSEQKDIFNNRKSLPERKIKSSVNPKMSRLPILIAAFLLLATATAESDSPTAYSLLQSYNFPVGILPKGVVAYDLDTSTGKFHAYFNGSCSFSLVGSYQLNYKSTISGYISENKLTKLSGIKVKVLFLWLNIVEVVRKGEEMAFSVGITSANFDIEEFLESPQCGCGFECEELSSDKFDRSFPFVSSS
ncbi:unnamed protein product [Brassica napus]|uniref:(rape) hypothetical protein n=1 Tax=Brassica napus TaxID=3708 RepID=A0A816VV77_BRANA|nr:unnamed protein product [Brassica napus]